jgi:hypothetical protein
MTEFKKTRHKNRAGRCFELSFTYLLGHPEYTLVHGTLNSDVLPIAHAWIENQNGFVYDLVQNQEFPVQEYCQKFQAKKVVTYSQKEAAKLMVEAGGTAGPWDEGYMNIPGLVHH